MNASFNLSNIDVPLQRDGLCMTNGQLNAQCVYSHVCSQISAHFVKAGLIILLLDFVYPWAILGAYKWALKGNTEQRTEVFNFVRARIEFIKAMFILMVVYLSISTL